ncbi:MAG: phasin family protein [Ectothiorhodospiraceae bacterium]|nr:phasin family protein [Chromatiales bacterium]MCP5153508.1 phasin family protein [Ectothiorhodospiraceae bacterium]
MKKDMFSNVETFAQAGIESMKKLGDINLRAFERMAEAQIGLVGTCVDSGVRQMSSFGKVKDVPAMMEEQMRLMNEMRDQLTEHGKRTTEILTEARTELTAWWQDGMKSAGVAAKPEGKRAA